MRSIRHQGWKELKRWPFDWSFIKDGKDSGFHPCCIATFKVRILLMFGHATLFNSYGLFTKLKLKNPGYVVCPYHMARLYAAKQAYVWYWCSRCYWSQIRNDKCNRCGTKSEVMEPGRPYPSSKNAYKYVPE